MEARRKTPSTKPMTQKQELSLARKLLIDAREAVQAFNEGELQRDAILYARALESYVARLEAG